MSTWTIADAVDYLAAHRLIALSIVSAIVLIVLWVGNIVGPGSTAKLSGRDVKPLPAPIWIFGALLVYIAAPLAAQFLNELPQLAGEDELKRKALVQLGAIGAGALTGFALLFVMAKSAPNAGLRMKASDVAIGLGAFAFALPLVWLAGEGGVALYKELKGSAPPALAHPTLETLVNNRSSQWAFVLAAVAVLGSPIWEEFVYRAFLQSAALRITGGQPWLAIVITSTLFTLVHRVGDQPVPWHALLPIFVLGVAMGVAYERTKRLGVPIVMHIAFNGLNVALALAGAGGE